MIETEAVDRFPTLGGKVETPSPVRSCGAKHRYTVPGTICHRHVWDWRASRIEDNTLDFLSALRLVNDNEFSNCHCSGDKERACNRDGYDPTHRGDLTPLTTGQ